MNYLLDTNRLVCETLLMEDVMQIGIDEIMSKLVQSHYPTEEILESLASALEDQSRRVKAHGNEELAKALWGEATVVRGVVSSVAK